MQHLQQLLIVHLLVVKQIVVLQHVKIYHLLQIKMIVIKKH